MAFYSMANMVVLAGPLSKKPSFWPSPDGDKSKDRALFTIEVPNFDLDYPPKDGSTAASTPVPVRVVGTQAEMARIAEAMDFITLVADLRSDKKEVAGKDGAKYSSEYLIAKKGQRVTVTKPGPGITPMPAVNVAILAGQCVRFREAGKAMSVTVRHQFYTPKDAPKEIKDANTSWIDLMVFGDAQTQRLKSYLKEKDQVFVQGRIEVRKESWKTLGAANASGVRPEVDVFSMKLRPGGGIDFTTLKDSGGASDGSQQNSSDNGTKDDDLPF